MTHLSIHSNRMSIEQNKTNGFTREYYKEKREDSREKREREMERERWRERERERDGERERERELNCEMNTEGREKRGESPHVREFVPSLFLSLLLLSLFTTQTQSLRLLFLLFFII